MNSQQRAKALVRTVNEFESSANLAITRLKAGEPIDPYVTAGILKRRLIEYMHLRPKETQ